ncbi:MAG: alkaline phosphatase family protein [Planctomycetes bacterium]|nr:alkaline phosphatase family protein [Planctomycetota bacterium]
MERYRLSFRQPHIQELMSRLPTYMMLDDHEIEDNWTQDRVSEKTGKYAAAMHAYQSYQMIHGPAYEPALGPVEKIWYSFRHGAADFFVLDTRTERFIENRVPRILGDRQMKALLAWLLAPTNNIKFVVSSVPLFPDGRSRSKDKWSGFEAQRLKLLDFIRDHAIKRVVFLSGDVHCSMTSELACSTHPDFKVHSIISSSFFWPYPQGQDSDFDLTGALARSGESRYEVVKTSDVISADNFTRVTGNSNGIHVQVYDRKGYKKDSQVYSF